MKRYKSPFLENEKRTNPDSDRRKPKYRHEQSEPLWGELIKELGPEIKEFLITTAESHKRMTDAEERKASTEERTSESITGLVEHLKTGIKVIAAAPDRKKHAKNNDKHHQEVKKIILKMREKGETHQNIADYLDKIGIPTLSGRGKWHAQTVHRLYQEYEESL